ncbi:MFS general substrate transporter [Hypoxylon rubiginosum]|uniref:MFS general substrate transporter n=1 Tax=Hypoxylon rubiginosum TaxID=110542 RepID=A0ACC0CKP8_9PEZI|nr:MFS general substrate transporter [Hypoxylon rubiginosum]
MLIFNTWGVIITFGDYQAFYESGQLFTQTSSNISWIGSIQALLVFVMGAVVGPIYDRGYLKPILFVGSFFIVFGHMMLSLCTQYWQVVLAQGFVIGIGGGCLFVPSLAVLQPYFSKNLGLALGIAATGSSAGGVIYPVIFINLIDRPGVGFGWTVRVMGFVALATLLIPLAFSQMRTKPSTTRSVIDTSAFADGPYMLCVLACFLGYTGCYTAFYYTSYYAQSNGWTTDSLALYLVPIMNGASAFGRALPNWLTDKIGPTNVIIPGALMTGVLLLCNLAVYNAAGIICTTAFLGFFSGVFFATPPVLIIALTKDKSKVGTRMGMAFAMIGLGVLTGGPGGGGVLQRDPSALDWRSTWTYAGVFALGSGALFCVLRTWQRGFKLAVKV